MNSIATPSLPRTQALILAGGRGKRLFPLTVSRPKPAIPFGGIFRIVDFTLSNCLHSKLQTVALLTQYRHEDLHSYIRDAWSETWKNSRHTTEPIVCLQPCSGKRYRGTADAVFQNLGVLNSNRPDYVLVLSSDQIYHMDYRELLAQHVEMQADLTIAAIEHPLRAASRFGVVEVDRDFRVTGFQEKPLHPRPLPSKPDQALVSMGVYVFKTDVLIESLTENCEQRFGYDFGKHIIPSLIERGRIYAYDFRDCSNDTPRYWRDIGTIDSYYDANMDLVRPNSEFNPYVNDYDAAQITFNPLVSGDDDASQNPRVHSNCHVSRTVLSPSVRIEKEAHVQDCVLLPGAHVGAGTAIRRAIVADDVQIPADFRVGYDLHKDRQQFFVTPSGVVVVDHTPRLRNTILSFRNGDGRNPQQVVA